MKRDRSEEDLIRQLIDRIDERTAEFERDALDPWKNPDAVCSFLKAKVVESIRQEMRRKRIGEADLARKMGLQRQQVHSMLNETGNFTLKTLARFAVALEVTISVDFAKQMPAVEQRVVTHITVPPMSSMLKREEYPAYGNAQFGAVEVPAAEVRHVLKVQGKPVCLPGVPSGSA